MVMIQTKDYSGIKGDNIGFNDEFEIENKLLFKNSVIVELTFYLGRNIANWKANNITSWL